MTALAKPPSRPALPGGKRPPALVLNADYNPLSYYPLSLWSWEDAIRAVYNDKADIVATYNQFIHSPSQAIRLPSVIALKNYTKPQEKVAFTRFNLFLRDEFTCQYCNRIFVGSELTFDHVTPRCRGGGTHWENIVAACLPCNLKKGNKTLEKSGMHLHHKPHQPKSWELQRNGRKFPPNHLHSTWLDFLYWDVELEADAQMLEMRQPLITNATVDQPDKETLDLWLSVIPAHSARLLSSTRHV